jgi:hypothetical protein
MTARQQEQTSKNKIETASGDEQSREGEFVKENEHADGGAKRHG